MQSLQYRLVLKDGKVQLEMVNCTGPACDPNAERVRRFLGLDQFQTVSEEYKPEYTATTASADAETVANL